jgi:hypothetical protein
MHSDSLKRHIEHMEHSHEVLEKNLVLLEKAHRGDSIEAHDIKKKKLLLKDELVRHRQRLKEMLQ